LEGHVVAWSDRIAYINHDIDDAIRGGIIKNEDIPPVFRETFGDKTGKRLNSMIMDFIGNSFGKNIASPSNEFKDKINGLRKWMFENVYVSSEAKAEEGKAVDMIKFLYEYFYYHKDKIPREFLDMDSTLEQKVCDYIAMMSDTFAVKTFEDITVPKSWSKL
jgi:dGTPase